MSKLPWSTIIKLGIASLIVGTMLSIAGADPFDFWEGVWDSIISAFHSLFGFGWGGLKSMVHYMALGAVVVIPIWAVISIAQRNRPNKKLSRETTKD